jgi:hypothetical protein
VEVQTIINIAVAVSGFFGGWVINSITKTLDRIDHEQRGLADKYVTKIDYHRDIDELKELCKSIFNKLDQKQDKN